MDFLTNIYDELLKVKAQLEVVTMAQYALEDITEENEQIHSVFDAVEVAKDHVQAVADDIDCQIYKQH